MLGTIISQKTIRDLKLAFIATIPVLFGYIAIGIAFGLLLQKSGYHWIIALLMSVFIYAGAAQYLTVGFFISNATLIEISTIIFLVNFRHMVYGLSLFDKFAITGKLKPYMIFSLTDETYALLTSLKEPEGINKGRYYFYISLLNHFYWVAGSIIGAIAGGFITIDTRGLDFALTALFIVLLLEQYKSIKSKIPILIGAFTSILSIILLGKGNMLLASVILSIVVLFFLRSRLETNESK